MVLNRFVPLAAWYSRWGSPEPPLYEKTSYSTVFLHEEGIAQTVDDLGKRRRRWPIIGLCVSALCTMMLVTTGSVFFWEELQDLTRWRPPLKSYLQPTPDRAPPSLPPSESFKRVLPLVTSSREGRREYDRLVREYKYENRTKECGSWQGRYTKRHNDIISGNAPGEILTADGPGGYADKLLGFVSSFVLAILMDKAWTASSYHTHAANMPDIRYGLESPNINWARTERVPEGSDNLYIINIERDDLLKDWIQISRTKLQAQATTPVTKVAINRGLAINYLLDDQTWAGEKLRNLGFTPENVYSCVLDYLFRPVEPTLDLLAQYHGVLSHPSVFSVSIQIRVGDPLMHLASTKAELKPEDYAGLVDLNWWNTAFECAAAVSEKYAGPQHQHLVWTVQTDFAPISRKALNDLSFFLPTWSHPTLGKPHFLNTEIKPHHMDETDNPQLDAPPQELTFEQHEFNFQTTILDQHMQDSVDFRLASTHSGFAVMSALRSWPKHGNHTILWPNAGSDCSRDDVLISLREIAVEDPKSA